MRVSSVLCIGVVASIGVDAAHAESWEHELTAVVWASGLDGRESIGPVSVDVDASFGDLLEFLDAGGAMRFTAQRERIGWFIEGSYVELSDETTRPTPTTVEFAQTLAELGMSIDVIEDFAVYGGARYQALDIEINNIFLSSVRKDVDWIDAIVGIRWTPNLGNTWAPWLRGDIGTGGCNFQWLAEAGIAWRFADTWSTQLAYRALDVDYESGGFVYDMRQSGLMLGLSIRF